MFRVFAMGEINLAVPSLRATNTSALRLYLLIFFQGSLAEFASSTCYAPFASSANYLTVCYKKKGGGDGGRRESKAFGFLRRAVLSPSGSLT
jgi:hypothetical protein